jgi:hypothetical protein
METESPPDLPTLAPELQQRVRDELEPDERLIWVGQPIPKLLRWSEEIVGSFLFGMGWTSMVVIFTCIACWSWWMKGVPFDFEQVLILLFLLLFLGIGFAFLSYSFWKYKRSFHAIYALTNRRAIFWKPAFPNGWNVQSTRPGDLGIRVRKEYYFFLFRREFLDGSGDVIIQEFTSHEPNKHSESEWIHHRIGFFAIPNVKAVEALVRKTLLEKSEPAV